MTYLQVFTLGTIIKSSFGIYFHHFLTILLIYVLPRIPIQLLRLVDGSEASILGAVLDTVISLLITFPMTVAISEICLGIKPSVARAYIRGFATPGRVLGTFFLAGIVIGIGFALLIIPGIVFALWYAFVGPVVILEGHGGWAALRRSRQLGRGNYLRNFGILLSLSMIVALIILSVVLVAATVIALIATLPTKLAEVSGAVVGILVTPPYLISLVLLYYDMRARKEGYSAAQLAEDLKA